MIEKIIPYLSDFCADGSSKGPLLNQKVGIEMHKKRVGGGRGRSGVQMDWSWWVSEAA